MSGKLSFMQQETWQDSDTDMHMFSTSLQIVRGNKEERTMLHAKNVIKYLLILKSAFSKKN